jgi:hypothetical protein
LSSFPRFLRAEFLEPSAHLLFQILLLLLGKPLGPRGQHGTMPLHPRVTSQHSRGEVYNVRLQAGFVLPALNDLRTSGLAQLTKAARQQTTQMVRTFGFDVLRATSWRALPLPYDSFEQLSRMMAYCLFFLAPLALGAPNATSLHRLAPPMEQTAQRMHCGVLTHGKTANARVLHQSSPRHPSEEQQACTRVVHARQIDLGCFHFAMTLLFFEQLLLSTTSVTFRLQCGALGRLHRRGLLRRTCVRLRLPCGFLGRFVRCQLRLPCGPQSSTLFHRACTRNGKGGHVGRRCCAEGRSC